MGEQSVTRQKCPNGVGRKSDTWKSDDSIWMFLSASRTCATRVPQTAFEEVYSKAGAPQSANTLVKRTDVRERVNEIQSLAAQSSAEAVAFDQKRVLNRLDVLSRKAEELGQISAAARCEELIGKQRGMFVHRSALLWETDPDKMTPDQLDVIADHLIRKALGDNPAAVAEAQRLIEAGETPTIEDCMRVVGQEPGK